LRFGGADGGLRGLDLSFDRLYLCAGGIHRLCSPEDSSRSSDFSLSVGGLSVVQLVHIGLGIHPKEHLTFSYEAVISNVDLNDFTWHSGFNLGDETGNRRTYGKRLRIIHPEQDNE
jgi:hypothetical protein